MQNPFNYLRKPALAWAPGMWMSLERDQSLYHKRQLHGGTDWIGHFVYSRGTWVRRAEHWKTRPWNLTFCCHLFLSPFPLPVKCRCCFSRCLPTSLVSGTLPTMALLRWHFPRERDLFISFRFLPAALQHTRISFFF